MENKQGHSQIAACYIANGLLSAISDNVFVATIYITESKAYMIVTLHGLVSSLGLDGADLITGYLPDQLRQMPRLWRQTGASAAAG